MIDKVAVMVYTSIRDFPTFWLVMAWGNLFFALVTLLSGDWKTVCQDVLISVFVFAFIGITRAGKK